ncbi:PCYCGC domain-containing protein [Guptibacillus algicola]|uniref:PCYCGC domain-containing protein n=1 Tax=Guptibacillus algicola TaxID=225844 RepID=UPI001CD3C1FD|nr:PCYCGC domain-containing protein [Alkalihalobacillus algicola]MCA0989180.1 PCYCGC domain-containing protein [Alkalihalobacillus algicola]
MKVRLLALVSLLMISVVTGCNSSESHQEHTSNGDIQETTELNELPTFLENQHDTVQAIYSKVESEEDLLEHIPCYCGCGEMAGHMNNYDCFVHDKTDDTVTWDDHGTKCGVCLDIAVKAIDMKENGKSVTEIRTYIDQKYESGYGKPTPTPLPEA